MGSNNQPIPAFLDRTVTFPDGKSFEIVKPLTDLRRCHDGKPLEARIVFVCKQIAPVPTDKQESEFVMKVKVQAPSTSDATEYTPVEGPSTTTAHELKALEAFTNAKNPHVPHLIAFTKGVQGANGMMPGGYLTYTLITKLPGQDLLAARFWDMSVEAREEIVSMFLNGLRSLYDLGIEPVDCALRNVLWDAQTKTCSIVDFELWREATETFSDDIKELERWGLAKRKVPANWWTLWSMHH